MHGFKLYLLITLSLIVSQLFAQLSEFKNILPGETLAQNCITCIYQDSDDYMWFGTKYGLLKYDGYDFIVYKINPEDPNSIKGNFIRDIYEHLNGKIYIATDDGGLNIFDPKTEIFSFIETDLQKVPGPEGTYSWAVEADSKGIIWVGHVGSGLCSLNPETGKVIQYLHDPKNANSLSDNNVKCIWIDENDILWIGTEKGGINRFDPETTIFTHFKKEEENPHSIQDNNIWEIFEDHQNNLWIATHTYGIYQFDKTTYNFTSDKDLITRGNPGEFTNIMCVFEDKNNNLWAGSWHDGLYKWKNGQKGVFNFQLNFQTENPIPITRIYSDRSGLIWIGTEFNGLFIHNPNEEKFRFLNAEINGQPSLSANHVHSLCEDGDGNILIGTFGGGINNLNTTSKQVIDWNSRLLFHNDENVTCLLKDDAGNFWIGTNHGLYLIEYGSGRVKHFEHNPNDNTSISSNYIMCLMQDHLGDVWVGTIRHGINVINPKTSQIKYYQHNENDSGSISSNNIRCFEMDQENTIWVGTLRGGLNKFDRKNITFVNYKNEPGNSNSLSNNSVRNIFIDNNEIMWLATNGGGLNRLDLQKKEFNYFSQKDGLPSDVICGIIGDKNGDLWISTPKGLSNFRSMSNSFFNYDENDGLQKQEFIPGATLQATDGTIYFGGYGGLNYFHPDSLNRNQSVPLVHINTITNFQKELIPTNHKIQIEAENNMLSIRYTAVSYIHPEKNQYAYQLIGYDTNWNYIGKKRIATYNELPSGVYDFHVKASNNDGIWNEEGAHILIEVKTPFLKSWQFIVMLILIIFGLSIGLLIIRKKIQQKKSIQDRYKGSTLKPKDSLTYNDRLERLMSESKPYLEYTLNLNKCAELLELPPHHLSQIINQFHHKNFSDYINGFRIEEAKRLIRETNQKVEAIAFESGFNSPTAFYAAFKKFTKKTPTQYRKSIS